MTTRAGNANRWAAVLLNEGVKVNCKFCSGDVQKGRSGLFYWCANCHMWLSKNTETVERRPTKYALDAAMPPSAEPDSGSDIVPASVAGSQPRK